MARQEDIRIAAYTLIAYLLFPFFLLAVWVRKRRFVSPNRPRILVVPVLRRIGDVVSATPVFRAIKEQYPAAFLAVAAGKNVLPLLKENPRADEIINVGAPKFSGFLGRGRLFLHIARERFDWVIALPPSPLHNLLLFYSFAPQRIGTRRQDRSRIERITDHFASERLHYRDHTSVPAHYLRLLESLGIKNAPLIKEVFFSKDAEARARDYFMRMGVGESDFLVGMSITAGNKIKEWGDEKFADLYEKMRVRFSTRFALFGGKSDEERIKRFVETIGVAANILILTGIPLDELPAYMRRLNLFIAADTGPIYIAHALGVPLIDIVGPVDPREQPPEDAKSILVKPPASIQPSSFVFKRPGKPEERRRAIESITVERVMGAMEEMARKIAIPRRNAAET